MQSRRKCCVPAYMYDDEQSEPSCTDSKIKELELLEFYGLLNTAKVMSSRSVNLLTIFPGQVLPFKRLISTCAHTLASN